MQHDRALPREIRDHAGERAQRRGALFSRQARVDRAGTDDADTDHHHRLTRGEIVQRGGRDRSRTSDTDRRSREAACTSGELHPAVVGQVAPRGSDRARHASDRERAIQE